MYTSSFATHLRTSQKIQLLWEKVVPLIGNSHAPAHLHTITTKNRWNLLWAFLSSKTGNLTPPNGSLYSLMEEDESTTLCHDNKDLDLLDFFDNEEGGSITSTEHSHSLSHCDLLLHLAGAHIWDSIQTECRL